MSSFPAHDHAARREQIRAHLVDEGLDAIVVTHGIDVRWLTGLVSSNAQVLIGADAAADLLWTDNRYAERADATGMAVSLEPWTTDLATRVAGTVAFQAEHLTVAQHTRLVEVASEAGFTASPTTGIVAARRRWKDSAELARIELACALTSSGWDWLTQQAIVGRTERDIARALVRHLEDLGADGPAFRPIVASGPNSAVPHHEPTDRVVQHGDLVKVDYGAAVEGYLSDCTRMLAVGTPDARLAELHAAVLAAQEAGVRAAVEGATAGDVDAAAVGRLEELDLGPTLHGVGHGLGLEIHESPILSSEPTATLESGFVVTVEPGIYLSGIGGVRIEDTIVVTSDGPRRLTTCARDLVVL